MIGKFEELTLLALMKAGSNSYAAEVFREFENSELKPPQFAAVYTALDRMARKGLVREASDPDAKNRRLFTITGEGRKALTESVGATRALGGFAHARVFGS